MAQGNAVRDALATSIAVPPTFTVTAYEPVERNLGTTTAAPTLRPGVSSTTTSFVNLLVTTTTTNEPKAPVRTAFCARLNQIDKLHTMLSAPSSLSLGGIQHVTPLSHLRPLFRRHP